MMYLLRKTHKQAFSVITMRLIQNFAGRAVSGHGYALLRSCAQIDSDGVLPAAVILRYWPECTSYFSGMSPGQQALVRADYHGLPAEVSVALSLVSGASALLALLLHAVGVEVYVSIPMPASQSAGEARCGPLPTNTREISSA